EPAPARPAAVRPGPTCASPNPEQTTTPDDGPAPPPPGLRESPPFSPPYSINIIVPVTTFVAVAATSFRPRPVVAVAGFINSNPGTATHRNIALWFIPWSIRNDAAV